MDAAKLEQAIQAAHIIGQDHGRDPIDGPHRTTSPAWVNYTIGELFHATTGWSIQDDDDKVVDFYCEHISDIENAYIDGFESACIDAVWFRINDQLLRASKDRV